MRCRSCGATELEHQCRTIGPNHVTKLSEREALHRRAATACSRMREVDDGARERHSDARTMASEGGGTKKWRSLA